MMKRRWFIASLGGTVLTLPRFTAAQARVARVAVLTARLPSQMPLPFWQAFVDGLRERGWEEGRNIEFHVRAGGGIEERYKQLSAELVALKPDLIIASGSQATQAARQQSNSVPIVMVGTGDPWGRASSTAWRDRAATLPASPTSSAISAGRAFKSLRSYVPAFPVLRFSGTRMMWDLSWVQKRYSQPGRSTGLLSNRSRSRGATTWTPL